jgi:hypothetical protein
MTAFRAVLLTAAAIIGGIVGVVIENRNERLTA